MTKRLYDAAKAVVDIADNKAAKPTEFAEAFQNLKDVLRDTPIASDEEIALARDLHQIAEVQIDERAYISEADNGYWVSAWVWVPKND